MIDLRDYFAAHAPAHAWAWYRPILPPAPAQPSADPRTNTGRMANKYEAERLLHWRCEPEQQDIDEEGSFSMFSDWCDAWRTYWKANAEWRTECMRQQDLQWRYFYADAMLEQRRKGHGD